MKLINIYDIDGCILPSVYANFSPNEKTFGNKAFVELKNKQLNRVQLFDYFKLWYAEINQKYECINIFITGRKASEYSDITIKQLRPLEKIGYTVIYFYPESLEHRKVEYNIWKFISITEIIKIVYDNQSQINIFDDLNEYFNILNEYSRKYNLRLFLANSNEFWMRLCQVKEGI